MRRPYQGKFHPSQPQKYAGNPENIVYRSGLEFRMMRYFDATAAIVKWSSEEIKIPYIKPGPNDIHTYYPDFFIQVRQKDGKTKNVLIEVKPSSQCGPPNPPKTKRQQQRFLNETMTYAVNEAKWNAAKDWAIRYGAEFLILTEKEIEGKFS